MEEKTNVMKELATFIVGFTSFLVAFGIAGRFDYQEEVISSINNEAYAEIVEKVGNNAEDIIREYKLHREYYDSLSY